MTKTKTCIVCKQVFPKTGKGWRKKGTCDRCFWKSKRKGGVEDALKNWKRFRIGKGKGSKPSKAKKKGDAYKRRAFDGTRQVLEPVKEGCGFWYFTYSPENHKEFIEHFPNIWQKIRITMPIDLVLGDKFVYRISTPKEAKNAISSEGAQEEEKEGPEEGEEEI